jgi:TonB family protein
MTLLVAAAVKVSLVLVAALAATRLLRRRSAALRHWVLTVALACAAATPVLTSMTPSWRIGIGALSRGARASVSSSVAITTAIAPRPAGRHVDAAQGTTAARTALTAPTLAVWLPLIWIAGASLNLAVLCVGLVRLRRLAACARRLENGRWAEIAADISRALGVRHAVALLHSDHQGLLVTWGVASPSILLPAGAEAWSDERARIVLRHELEHIRRGDWIVQLLGETLRAVYWFNPLMWLACRQLRRESEHACDDAVLGGGVEPADYAAQLLDLARILSAGRSVQLPAPAMARSSSLEGRISAMLNTHLDRRPLLRSTRIATILLLAALTVPIAGMAGQRFSKFTGTVLDQTNGFLPDTTLSLTNKDSRARNEVRTDRTGRFEFLGLPDGEYALEVWQLGFAPLTEVVTIAGRDLDRNLELQVGSLQETITVVGGGSATTAAARPETIQQRRQLARAQQAEETRLRAAARCTEGAGAMGGNLKAPTKLVDVKPQYPAGLASARVGGVVTLEAVIGTDGTTGEVRALQSPDPDLAQAAIDAVRQWEFTPTILNCTPVEVHMSVTVTFVAQP